MLKVDLTFPPSLIIAPDGAAVAAPSGVDAEIEPCLDGNGNPYGFCSVSGDQGEVRIYGVGSFVFTRGSVEVRGTPDPGVTWEAFRMAFEREVLPLVLVHQSWEVLHASGLVVAGACIALCGSTQMGKSTLAYAWRRRGGSVYADDAIPFQTTGGLPRVQALPFQIRLRPPSRQYYGVPNEALQRSGAGCPPWEGSGILRSIYLLDRRLQGAGGTVELEPLPPAAALPALLGQAYCLTLRDRCRSRQMLDHYLTLVNAVPAFRLSYPTGLDHVEMILDRIEEHASNWEAFGPRPSCRREPSLRPPGPERGQEASR